MDRLLFVTTFTRCGSLLPQLPEHLLALLEHLVDSDVCSVVGVSQAGEGADAECVSAEVW